MGQTTITYHPRSAGLSLGTPMLRHTRGFERTYVWLLCTLLQIHDVSPFCLRAIGQPQALRGDPQTMVPITMDSPFQGVYPPKRSNRAGSLRGLPELQAALVGRIRGRLVDNFHIRA